MYNVMPIECYKEDLVYMFTFSTNKKVNEVISY